MVHLTWAFVLCSSILCFVKSAQIGDFERWAECKKDLDDAKLSELPSCFGGLKTACEAKDLSQITKQFSEPCRLVYRDVVFDNAGASQYMEWQAKHFNILNRKYVSHKKKLFEGDKVNGYEGYFLRSKQNLEFLTIENKITDEYDCSIAYIVRYVNGQARLAYIKVADTSMDDPHAVVMYVEYVKSQNLAVPEWLEAQYQEALQKASGVNVDFRLQPPSIASLWDPSHLK
ncbi:hypothetical protein CROQUDRAFT_89629 [Cronartium quercuum f. sp. fusiforme G11]|uniref:Uncharacterized protein n=1 Tax=Cronartium quercuum f. sp. fusiforme G11 TaxID=708437 RepID=A0A9P6NNA9_9BASI|nr:hypothetical protein CROQUDRAFT_89629 [Cronartium quercuum f. sp. fusiforme G11]